MPQPDLGTKLRALRTDRGLSIAEVADATGISASFLSLVENGRSDIAIGRLMRLIDFYGVGLGRCSPRSPRPMSTWCAATSTDTSSRTARTSTSCC